MKKLSYFFGIAAIMAATFSSCNKCYDCSGCDLEALDDEYCWSEAKDDGLSRSEAKEAIDELEEDWGCTCK